ncbi:hypothetical protein NDU88_003355 [Pleurodeles waltl]|uniref:Uncharacterized protein n=1 Tax=Pleurodeles waltl TaxID=8319 RepID=A0AAV7MRK2_PLEWA|nr:hypothetical protein NDU88_003355 [Pleurodeles waltl]
MLESEEEAGGPNLGRKAAVGRRKGPAAWGRSHGLEAAAWAERAAVRPRAEESAKTLGGVPGAGAAPTGEQVSCAGWTRDSVAGTLRAVARDLSSRGGVGRRVERKLDAPAPGPGSCWCPPPPEVAESADELWAP